jgi:hypothetical protein
MEIDELDRRILRELRKDGRLTNTKLAGRPRPRRAGTACARWKTAA